MVVHALAFLSRGRLTLVGMACYQGIIRIGSDWKRLAD